MTSLPASPLSDPPLMWAAFAALSATTARHEPSSAWLLRLALDPSLDVTERHAGQSLLVAALRHARASAQGAVPTPETAWPLPGQPWAGQVRGVREAVPAALIWRGLDPFEGLDQEQLVMDPYVRGVVLPHCPLLLALQQGLTGVVDQMLRLPQAPAMAHLEQMTTPNGQPWLHACVNVCPGMAEVLLRHGYNPNHPDANGQTALMAVQDAAGFKLLVAHGATVDGPVLRAHWIAEGRPALRSLEKLLPDPPDQPDAFQAAFAGFSGGLPKHASDPLVVPGFDQPLSLRAIALLGVLLNQPTQPNALRFDALKVLLKDPHWSAQDRQWAALFGVLKGPRGQKASPTAYEDATKAKRRERWANLLQAVATSAGAPSPQEGWQAAQHLWPQIAAFTQASPVPKVQQALLNNDSLATWAKGVAPEQVLAVLDRWPGRFPNDAFAELKVRQAWQQHLAHESQHAPWDQVFSYLTVYLRFDAIPEAGRAPELHARLAQLSPAVWAQDSPERRTYTDLLARLAHSDPNHPQVRQGQVLDRALLLDQRPASVTPNRPRNRPRA